MLSEKDACRLTLLRLMPYCLLHVLIKKHALEKYVNNVLNLVFSSGKNKVRNLTVWLHFIHLNKFDALYSSFHWNEIPEGEYFWKYINNDYLNYYFNGKD